MSKRYPIIAVTGSSGAGTTTVKVAFEHIFYRLQVNPVIIEGDSFHRHNRAEMADARRILQCQHGAAEAVHQAIPSRVVGLSAGDLRVEDVIRDGDQLGIGIGADVCFGGMCRHGESFSDRALCFAIE